MTSALAIASPLLRAMALAAGADVRPIPAGWLWQVGLGRLPLHCAFVTELRILIGILLLSLLLRLAARFRLAALHRTLDRHDRCGILHMRQKMLIGRDFHLRGLRVVFVRIHPVAQGLHVRLVVLHECNRLRELPSRFACLDFLLLDFSVFGEVIKLNWKLIQFQSLPSDHRW